MTIGKLIESTLVSLDGVTEAPEQWVIFDDEAAALFIQQLGNYYVFVMGRVTYEQLFAYWGHTAGNPYIDRINAMPKYVASRSLKPGRHGMPPSSGPTRPARSPG